MSGGWYSGVGEETDIFKISQLNTYKQNCEFEQCNPTTDMSLSLQFLKHFQDKSK